MNAGCEWFTSTTLSQYFFRVLSFAAIYSYSVGFPGNRFGYHSSLGFGISLAIIRLLEVLPALPKAPWAYAGISCLTDSCFVNVVVRGEEGEQASSNSGRTEKKFEHPSVLEKQDYRIFVFSTFAG